MKKLALMAAVAAIALSPVAAIAKHEAIHTKAGATPGHSYTVIDRDMDGKTIEYRTTTRSLHKQVDEEGKPDFTGKYSLIDGSTLSIEGSSAYLASADMDGRFFAPNSAYVTQRGQTFFVEDGQILRLENPPEVLAIDTNDIVR